MSDEDLKPVYTQGKCDCGHPWGIHDVNEYKGDGTETCCVHGCDQNGCPGRTQSPLPQAHS